MSFHGLACHHRERAWLIPWSPPKKMLKTRRGGFFTTSSPRMSLFRPTLSRVPSARRFFLNSLCLSGLWSDETEENEPKTFESFQKVAVRWQQQEGRSTTGSLNCSCCPDTSHGRLRSAPLGFCSVATWKKTNPCWVEEEERGCEGGKAERTV